MAGKWALVTGASSGFGVQFALLLASRGANLILVARRAEPMERLAGRLRSEHKVRVIVVVMDLSTPEAASALKIRTDAQGFVADVLVNTAGYGVYGEFLEQLHPTARRHADLHQDVPALRCRDQLLCPRGLQEFVPRSRAPQPRRPTPCVRGSAGG